MAQVSFSPLAKQDDRDEMMRQALMKGVDPYTNAPLSSQQSIALEKALKAPGAGQSAIMGAKATNPWTALAQIGGAGLSAKWGKEANVKTEAGLRKAMQAEQNEKRDRLEIEDDWKERQVMAGEQTAASGLVRATAAAKSAETEANKREYLNPEFVVPPGGGTPLKVVRVKGTHDYIDTASGDTVDLTGYHKAPTQTLTGDIEEPTPPSLLQSNYQDGIVAMGSMESIRDLRESMSDEDKELYGSTIKDIVAEGAPGLIKGAVTETFYGDNPNVQSMREEGAKAIGLFRRLIAGKQVTGMEFQKELDWSPLAAGLSPETRERRWDRIEEETLKTLRTYEGNYSKSIPQKYESREDRAAAAPPAGIDAKIWSGYTAEQQALLREKLGQ